MDTLSYDKNHPKQCRIKVGNRVVAYVCDGENKPINWLPAKVSGLQLTEDERIKVAKYARGVMAERHKKQRQAADELARLSSPNYSYEKSESEDGGTDEDANPGIEVDA
jgi:hypothetical protein